MTGAKMHKNIKNKYFGNRIIYNKENVTILLVWKKLYHNDMICTALDKTLLII